MGQCFGQLSQLFPQLLRLRQFRLIPKGEHPAEGAVRVGKAAGEAQPPVWLHGETACPVFLHQPPAATGFKEHGDLILRRKEPLRLQIRQGCSSGWKALPGGEIRHAVELEQAEILTAPAPAPHIPGRPVEHQIAGLHRAHRFPFGGEVGKADGAVLLDGALDQLDLGRQAGLVPGGEVNEHVCPARHQSARPGGQLLHQLGVAPGTADAVQAPKPRQNGLHLRGGEHRPVHPVALHDGDAAARTLGGGDGDARPAQGFDVPLDGSPGHLELLRQLRGGDPLPLEQDGQYANEPLHLQGDHRLSWFYLHYTIETGQLYVMFDSKATGLLPFALRLKNQFFSGHFSLFMVLFGCRKKKNRQIRKLPLTLTLRQLV